MNKESRKKKIKQLKKEYQKQTEQNQQEAKTKIAENQAEKA